MTDEIKRAREALECIGNSTDPETMIGLADKARAALIQLEVVMREKMELIAVIREGLQHHGRVTVIQRAGFLEVHSEPYGEWSCTCPSGDGSLHHPCPQHPPVGREDE